MTGRFGRDERKIRAGMTGRSFFSSLGDPGENVTRGPLRVSHSGSDAGCGTGGGVAQGQAWEEAFVGARVEGGAGPDEPTAGARYRRIALLRQRTAAGSSSGP